MVVNSGSSKKERKEKKSLQVHIYTGKQAGRYLFCFEVMEASSIIFGC